MFTTIQTHITIGFWVTVEIDGGRTQIKMQVRLGIHFDCSLNGEFCLNLTHITITTTKNYCIVKIRIGS